MFIKMALRQKFVASRERQKERVITSDMFYKWETQNREDGASFGSYKLKMWLTESEEAEGHFKLKELLENKK